MVITSTFINNYNIFNGGTWKSRPGLGIFSRRQASLFVEVHWHKAIMGLTDEGEVKQVYNLFDADASGVLFSIVKWFSKISTHDWFRFAHHFCVQIYVNEIGMVLRALGYTPPQSELDRIAADSKSKSQTNLSFDVHHYIM